MDDRVQVLEARAMEGFEGAVLVLQAIVSGSSSGRRDQFENKVRQRIALCVQLQAAVQLFGLWGGNGINDD